MKPSQHTIIELLNTVQDPELDCTIVELGLLRDITITEDFITITMTLTTPACPFVDHLETLIESALSPFDREVKIMYTFSPPWKKEDIDPIVLLKKGWL